MEREGERSVIAILEERTDEITPDRNNAANKKCLLWLERYPIHRRVFSPTGIYMKTCYKTAQKYSPTNKPRWPPWPVPR